MSKNYKFHNPEGLYFVSFAVVDWLNFFSHQPEGYVEPTVTSSGVEMNYVYQYKDHLGNIRLSYKNTGTVSSPILEIVEENNYYPFGLKHKGYNNVINGTDHKYGFGGKEEQDEFSLNWHDFGTRNYDVSLGRWMNLDPLAYKYHSFSPYTYALNNPIVYTDPDGMEVVWADNEKTEKAKERIDELRKSSEAFNKLFTYLEELTDFTLTINVDDEAVDEAARKSGVLDDELGNYRGFFDRKTKTAFFKESSDSQALSEEIFHGLQFYMNKKENNDQSLSDLEAEAKLFNGDVLEEEALSSSDGSITVLPITSGAESDIFFVKMAQSNTGSNIIESGENKNAYDNYVDSFYNYYKAKNNNHPYSRKKPTKEIPITYNQIQRLLKKN